MTRTGRRIELLPNAAPRRNAAGAVTGMAGVGQDTTNLWEAMAESVQVADDLGRLVRHGQRAHLRH